MSGKPEEAKPQEPVEHFEFKKQENHWVQKNGNYVRTRRHKPFISKQG